MKKLLALTFILAVGFVAFAQEPALAQPAPVETVKRTPKFPTVSVAEFAELIKADDVIIVDVRTEKEFSEGHIEGAVNMPLDTKFQGLLNKTTWDKGKRLAVYCRSGRRSNAAGRKFVDKGFKVVELGGGLDAWQKEEQPVVKN
ncbi:MAG: rhodanese-like domain-containing protein [Bacteroidales bacterium]|nr:rhodanese-like domain-containing protein [Bacteroidales bacterium]